MADPIGKGDWVEPTYNGKTGIFRVGCAYLVEGVATGEYGCEACDQHHGGLRIAGIPSSHITGAWPICSFRPIYRRRDAEALTAKLLVGARAKGPLVPAQVDREGSRETVK